MFLELGERHALWTRAARQKPGEEKGCESFHDMLSRLIDGRERRGPVVFELKTNDAHPRSVQ